MRSPIISTTADSISSGGSISGHLTIEGDLTVTGAGAGFAYSEVLTGDMVIQDTTDNATGGVLRLQNTKAGEAGDDADDAGTISFYAPDAGSNSEEMSTIISEIGLNQTNATAGKLTFKTMAANSSTALLTLNGWAGGSHGSDESSIVLNTGLVGIENSSLETWEKDWTALQIGGDGALSAVTTAAPGNDFFISRNTYYDETNSRWEYMSTNGDDEAEVLQLSNGMFTVSLTGTAGADDAAVSFTNVMVLDSNSRISLSNNNVSGATGNTVFGKLAGNALASGGTNNVFIGENAGLVHTIGDFNVVVGHSAFSDTNNDADSLASSGNIAIGRDAMGGTWAGEQTDNCVAIGDSVMTGALSDVDGTIAIGKSALTALTSGAENTAIGYQANLEGTTGRGNTVLGYRAMWQSGGDVTAQDNVFIGPYSGGGDWGGAGVDNNIGIGYAALNGVMNGANNNIGIGFEALNDITSGDNNIGIGLGAADKLTAGGDNIAIGATALDAADGGETSNIAIGVNAMGAVDEGANDHADANIAIGQNALTGGTLTDGAGNLSHNIAIGYDALADTGANDHLGTIAIGYAALGALTSGSGNVAVGYSALTTNEDGGYNTAVGYESLNVFEADASNHGQNTAVGYRSGKFVSTGTYNTFLGSGSGQGITGTRLTGDSNTAVGQDSGILLQGAAHENTFLGQGSGDVVTTGSDNTCIGFGADTDDATAVNQSVIGHSTTGVADNSVTLGNADVTNIYMASDKGANIRADNAKIYVQGVQFPATQSASGDANVLDDYEEGEIQPDVTCSGSGSYTKGGSRTYLAYTKIGRQVTLSGQIDITGESSPVGNLQVQLPFTVGATTEAGDSAFGTGVISSHGGTMVNNCTAIAHSGEAIMKFFNVADDGTFAYIDKDDVDTAFSFHISLTFIAA